ncbi:gamma-interferon-inducible lysosomal thiol reductase [Parasteatoda tepidariorum]|uniref:gamma-interferon-inducible lysosomal thiol reductase n=1 Tax=Parasteatoda tepidariorum TaxID=114398 RepID=UPI00077F879C|nr:gamma-interferon-inducible lysosomal thiol reductase [Parasteatoda tepidariorum]
MWCLFLTWLAAVSLQVSEAQYSSYHRRVYVNGRPIYPLHSIRTSGSSLNPVHRPLTSTADTEPVQLDIYYETNCPDSMRFVTQQLYPLYQEMKNSLKIRLIPFGKGTAYFNEVSKQYDFNCHHGPAECLGNTVQSCVISLYPQPEDHMNLVNCMEAYPRPSSSGSKCAKRLGLDWNKISKCADGEEGNRLLYENYKITNALSPRLNFVPWIVINRVYTRDQQRRGLRNLKEVVCENMKNNHPKCGKTFY